MVLVSHTIVVVSSILRSLSDPVNIVNRISCLEDDMQRFVFNGAEVNEKKQSCGVLSLLQLQVAYAIGT